MKTVVYQSYRTTNVPPWITRCMESVKSWSKQPIDNGKYMGVRTNNGVYDAAIDRLVNQYLPVKLNS